MACSSFWLSVGEPSWGQGVPVEEIARLARDHDRPEVMDQIFGSKHGRRAVSGAIR